MTLTNMPQKGFNSRAVPTMPGIILCMRPANGRWRYNVTSSVSGWAHTQNDPCNTSHKGIHMVLLCFVLLWSCHDSGADYLAIFLKVASLALGKSYDCLGDTSEVTLKEMDKINLYQTATNHNKTRTMCIRYGPDSKVRGANMGPIWGRQDPGGPHVVPMNFAIWGGIL